MKVSLNKASRRGTSIFLHRRQCGSLVINVAIAMSLIIIVLIGTELGYLFYMKREIQKAADLAALAGAQKISNDCTAAREAAKLSANGTGETDSSRNLPLKFSISDDDIECGQWDPKKLTPDRFEPAITGLNAVRVAINITPPAFFPSFGVNRTIQSKAVAINNSIASFSLGTGLVALDGGVVNKLLNALLGTGNKISLDIASYKGLATAQIRLLDLISASSSVGTVDQLLSQEITVNELALLMLSAIDPTNTLAIDVLNSIVSAGANTVKIKLGDLLSVTTPTSEAAASASINAFDLLMVAAQISNGKNAIDLGTALDLGPLLKIDSKLKVTSPPTIAIGEAGKDDNGNWKTQAHSASIRLFLDTSIVDTSKIPIISGIANIQALHLPLYIEVAPGDGWLSDIQCNNPKKDSVVSIGAQPGIANICIAENMAAQVDDYPIPINCTTPATVSRVSILDILGAPISLDVKATAPLKATPSLPNSASLEFDGTIGNSDDIQRTTSNAVGSVLSTAVQGLSDSLSLKACVKVLGIDICLGTAALTGILGTLKNSILVPIFNLLDTVIQPILGLLGVQLGYSDIHHQSLTCGEAKLVY